MAASVSADLCGSWRGSLFTTVASSPRSRTRVGRGRVLPAPRQVARACSEEMVLAIARAMLRAQRCA
eukprot:9324832-Lingulodinium_polyedra.AAC.1